MAVERVVLLLAFASLLAVHAADVKPASSFVDWLAQQSSTKAQTASSYYEEVESETVCLQGARIGSCSCLHEKNGVCTRTFSEYVAAAVFYVDLNYRTVAKLQGVHSAAPPVRNVGYIS